MSSPWARGASSPPGAFPPPAPYTPGPPPPGSRRYWLWALAALLVVGLSVGIGSVGTYMAVQGNKQAASTPNQSAAPATPQFTSTEVATAKQRVCQVFQTSVGHEGRGGFRVEGKINLPVNLQSVTSAVAVQNALGPTVPSDVNTAAHRYIDTTLDAMTAAMGGTQIDEVNRLTRLANAAVDAFADACGLPR